jgi:NAD-dependent SIR2 family protein deacetylase
MPRTVYIAGAGFSYPAGVPVQAGLLARVQELGVLDAPALVSEAFFEAQTTALDFITTISRSDTIPPLEDAFTLLDQTIATRGFCLGYSWQEAVVVRERLQRALLVVLHAACANVQNASFYGHVASNVLSRATSDDVTDSAAVLTLNWDSVFEDALFTSIRAVGGEKRLDVNFGCDTTALAQPSAHSPSVTQEARGVRSADVLKLHGSINWLLCPNCQALFSGAGNADPLWERYFGETSCEACTPVAAGGKVSAPLQPFLITPTFLKVFDNAHIQQTWQRAHRLLSKADEVVFLGYSLPVADFHLRTLLRKSVRRGARITAVLTENDKPDASIPPGARANFASTRYEEFFGISVSIDRRGVQGYFADILAAAPPDETDAKLRGAIEVATPKVP